MMKKKEERKNHKEFKKFKLLFSEKLEMFALISFIFALFLLDVNANMIGAYGSDVSVNLFMGKTISAAFLFWIGILFLGFCLFLLSTRSLYHPKRKHVKLDIIMSVIAVLGMMIILSGGMLLFWHGSLVQIPFFNASITRISYYHMGIFLEVISAFYFALVR